MTEIQAQISLLDTAYQKLSGVDFKERGVVNWRESGWAAFIKAGYTVRDLEEAVLWIKARIHQGKRDIGGLRWTTLIGSLDRFSEELALARAQKRNEVRPPTEKERVLAATGRAPAPPPNTVKRSKDVIEKLIADMRKEAQ